MADCLPEVATLDHRIFPTTERLANGWGRGPSSAADRPRFAGLDARLLLGAPRAALDSEARAAMFGFARMPDAVVDRVVAAIAAIWRTAVGTAGTLRSARLRSTTPASASSSASDRPAAGGTTSPSTSLRSAASPHADDPRNGTPLNAASWSSPHDLAQPTVASWQLALRHQTAPGGERGLRLSHYQLSGKSQGGVAAAGIFLWWFPFFSAAKKTEKSGICAKIVQNF